MNDIMVKSIRIDTNSSNRFGFLAKSLGTTFSALACKLIEDELERREVTMNPYADLIEKAEKNIAKLKELEEQHNEG